MSDLGGFGPDEAEAAIDRLCRSLSRSRGSELASVLGQLSARDLDAAELALLVAATRRRSELPAGLVSGDAIDTCGTGGGAPKPNVSTLVAIIVSAAGVPVAKHGSRSMRSKVGSIDLAAGLGIVTDLPARALARVFEQTGLVVLDAPAYNPVLRAVAATEQGPGPPPLFFRYVGPLTNPCGVTRQVVGTASPAALSLVAGTAARLPGTRVVAVHGTSPPVDEVAISGPTLVDDQGETATLTPADFGLEQATHPGGPATLAPAVELAEGILAGAVQGAVLDLVLANCAVVLRAAGAVTGVRDGAVLAREVVRTGAAAAHLRRVVALSRSLV